MDIMSYLFGPLDSAKYCYLYYLMQIGFFVMFLFTVIYFIYSRFTKTPQSFYITSSLAISYLFSYFINRLVYTICLNSFNK